MTAPTHASGASSPPPASSDDDLAPVGVLASFKYAFSSPRRLRTEVLAGLVVALALIPEAISFSILMDELGRHLS